MGQEVMLGCDVDTIVDDCFDAHSGETYCNILAYNKQKSLVGYLEYSIYRTTLNIKMIQVRDVCRRKGIASKLFDTLEQKHLLIGDMGYVTKDGEMFLFGYYGKKFVIED